MDETKASSRLLLPVITRSLTIGILLNLFATVAIAAPAKPKPAPAPPKPNPVTCTLDFTVSGVDIQIGIGYSKLKGSGRAVCIDKNAVKTNLPLKVSIGTPAIFPRFALLPHVKIHGTAEKIKIAKGGIKTLLGKYSTADAQVAVGGGAGAILDLQGETNGMVIELQLEDVQGFGIAVGGTFVTLSP